MVVAVVAATASLYDKLESVQATHDVTTFAPTRREIRLIPS